MRKALLLVTTLIVITLQAQPGTLDTTYRIGTGVNNSIYCSAIQADGKIVIGGYFTSYNGVVRNRVARTNQDGSLDTTFNTGIGANNGIAALAIQSDGKIIVGGYFTSYNSIAKYHIVRLNANGSLDSTFNTGGLGTDINGYVYAIVIQPDGKILIGGNFTSYDGIARNGIARLNIDGSIDTAFNSTGVTGSVSAIALNYSQIIIGGLFGATSGNYTATNIARLHSNGSIDYTFNYGGMGASDEVTALGVQSDGKIIVGGFFEYMNGYWQNNLSRLNTDGTTDEPAFNYSVNPTGTSGGIYSISVQPDDKIVIGGIFTAYHGVTTNYITRINATDGSQDYYFYLGEGSGASDYVHTTAIQADGKIIIGGDFNSYNGTGRVHLARIKGFCDTTFATSITDTACDRYNFFGTQVNSNGSYNHTLSSVHGCDSIITLHLTIKHSTSDTLSEAVCTSFNFRGTVLTRSGVYRDTIPNVVGCDSIIVLNLTINNSVDTQTVSACNSYFFNGTTLTQSGTYYDTLTNAAGCDSLIVLHLTIATPQAISVSIATSASFDCSQLVFTATPTNPGSHPFYQWKVNGNVVGTNAPTYAATSYTDGDVVICQLTDSLACAEAMVISASDTLILTGTAHHILYVKPNATGNGTSWSNAFGSLQAALDAASNCFTEIWVAAGTYKPSVRASFDLSPNPRRATFELKNIAMYGGFNGTETAFSQRNISANPTILSGNIGASYIATDNCFHVITSVNNSTATIVDGFTIRDGYANVSSSASQATGDSSLGGAVYTDGTLPNMHGSQAKFRNCTFTQNFSIGSGGACYINQGAYITQGGLSGQEYENCVFTHDSCRWSSSSGNGGAVYSNYTGNTFYKCQFVNNTAGNGGGGIFGKGTINSCYFTKDTAKMAGGAIYSQGGVTVSNSLIVNNHGYGAGAIYHTNGVTDIEFCTIYGNTANSSGGAIYVGASGLMVKDCIIWGNKKGGGQTPNAYDVYNPSSTIPTFADKNIVDTIPSPNSAVIRLNPLFVNSADIDGADNVPMTNDDGLRVTCNSPAVDSGVVSSFAVYDIVGNLRGNHPDLGAYEVSSGVTPTITVAASNDSICSTASVTFTATATNAGTTSSYQWKKNGLNVGSNSSSYTASNFANGDQVYCALATTSCSGTNTVLSDTITMNILPQPTAPTITASGTLSFCSGQSVTLTANGDGNYTWSNGAHTDSITIGTGGTYTVSTTSSNQCSAASAPVAVTVYPQPNATITHSGSTTFCVGDSLTLSAVAGNTYYWNNGATSQSITINQAGTYSLTVTNSSGCSVTSQPVTTTMITPTVPAITSTDNILISSIGNGNQWYQNGNLIIGATSQSYTVTQSGNYFAVTTDEYGCSAQSETFYLEVSGIADMEQDSFTMIPNPTFSVVTISGLKPNVPIIITNMLGEVLIKTVADTEKKVIDVSYLASGVYFVNRKKLVKL